MEWLDPVYCSGHWVPEMVRIAGGVDTLGSDGADSIRISWDEVRKWDPEVFVVMPCGFNLEKVVQECKSFRPIRAGRSLAAVRNDRVYAVDANAYYARPGPRVIEGTELLAHLIHPSEFPWNGRGVQKDKPRIDSLNSFNSWLFSLNSRMSRWAT